MTSAASDLRLEPVADLAPDTGRVTFIGNATVLLELGGLRILTDPNFLHQGDHAKLGGGLRTRRRHEPALPLEALLPVDLVVLSHHHGDHFDDVAAAGLPGDTPIVTTAHAARKLGRQGFRRTHALDTWQAQRVAAPHADVTITALPAKHAPRGLQAVLPPVMGSMVDVRTEASSRRIYISGDTLLHQRLAEIPQRFPEIDLALLHLGGTRIAGVLLTMDGEQGAAALETIDAELTIPIHFDDYTVMRSPLADFQHAVEARGLGAKVRYLARGERHTL